MHAIDAAATRVDETGWPRSCQRAYAQEESNLPDHPTLVAVVPPGIRRCIWPWRPVLRKQPAGPPFWESRSRAGF